MIKKQLYRFYKFIKKPYNIILSVLLIVLGYLTLFPMLTMIKDTFTVHVSESMRLKQAAGSWTLNHWFKVLFDPSSLSVFYKPFLNSLITSLGACLVALLFGGVFSWLITRTNIRWKKVLSSLFIFPYIMPSWTIALAWYNVFKNSVVGGVPGTFQALTGIEPPNWFAYGAFPIALVTGLHYAPFAYIMIGGVLRNMDANLEEAAMMLKTSRNRIVRKITIPMILPAILSTFLLVFSSAMSFSHVWQAASIMGTVDDDSVGKIDVVPCFMCAFIATRNASSVPSIKSRPPPPCTCSSTPPGTT